MGAYYADKTENKDSLLINAPITGFFEISGDSIHFKTFQGVYNESIDTVKSYPFTFRNNVLSFNNDSIVFEKITKDSLVIVSNGSAQYREVYKRVDIEKSPNIEFSKDIYAVEFDDWNDTLEFIENERVLRINDRDIGDGSVHEWYISSYKKLKFFVVIGQVDLPYLISEVDDDHIGIKFYYNKIKNGSINRLVNYESDKELTGNWEMTETKNVFGFLSCFQKEGVWNVDDSIARLKVDENALTLNQFGLETKINFWKDKTSRHIFLDTKDTTYTCTHWEIDWQNDSLIGLTTSFSSYNDMTFKKTSDLP